LRKADIFDSRVEGTTQLIKRLAQRAAGLPAGHKALFAEALEELQTSLEELQVAGEELNEQSEELAAARLAAEEGRQRYLELFDLAPDAYLVTDAQGIIVEANQRAGALLGAKTGSLLKKPLVLYVDRADRKAFFERLGGLKASGRLENWEIDFRPRRGPVFPGRVDITPIPGPDDGPAGFRWLVRDATEAKRQELLTRLATFPELNPEPVVEVDTAGHVYYLNPAAKRILHGLPEKGLEHPWLAGLGDLAERIWKSRRSSLGREVRIDDRWFLQQIWSPGRGGRLRIYGRDITDRKAVEDRLLASEKDYRDLVDNANSIIIRWKPSGEITYFNRFAQAFFGYSEKEILGRNVRILIPDRDSEGLDVSRLVDEVVAQPEFYAAHENENVVRGGNRVWVQWANKALFDEAGRVREILAIGNDMTARKKAEDELLVYQAELAEKVKERTAELTRSTELLERVFASVDLAIAYLDPDFDFIRVNRAFADAFGGTPESYAGQSLFTLYPDPASQAVFRKVVETGEPHVELESPFLLDDPKIKGTYWDWSLLRVATGDRVEGAVLSLVDVTPRVKAQEEGRRLTAAVEQSAEAVIISDMAGRILYVNRTFQTLHALSRQDVEGRLFADVLRLDLEDDAFRQRLRQALDKGETWKGRLTREIGGQADRKLDVTISAVRDPAGHVMNFAVLEHDATYEHKLETSLRNLQKLDAIGALSGGIAHDFNNILVPIFINTELAAFEAEKDSPLSCYLKLVLDSANRGRELVRQITAFSRPTEQKRDVIDLTAVVKEASGFLRSSIPRSIDLVERLDAAAGLVRADPTQIGQVLINLGTNAAYAMRERGGRLTIGLSDVVIGSEASMISPELVPGPYVKMTVEDTGSGIPPEVLDRIFEPFFTTKQRGEGTGMGLPVVQGIVRSHGGAIAVSTSPGQGTVFSVYFPAAKGKAKSAGPAPGTALAAKGRVLFVDDEDILVRSVKPMLERLGFSVTATTDPLEALAVFRRRPSDFDLIITDETMPGLTGERLAREMLHIRPDVPIILSTGFSATLQEDEVLAAGIKGFIMKPFSAGEIVEKIQAALKKD